MADFRIRLELEFDSLNSCGGCEQIQLIIDSTENVEQKLGTTRRHRSINRK